MSTPKVVRGSAVGKQVRYHIERVHYTDARGHKHWTRESIAGARTLKGARVELAHHKREAPSYYKHWRIVRVTTTRKVFSE